MKVLPNRKRIQRLQSTCFVEQSELSRPMTESSLLSKRMVSTSTAYARVPAPHCTETITRYTGVSKPTLSRLSFSTFHSSHRQHAHAPFHLLRQLPTSLFHCSRLSKVDPVHLPRSPHNSYVPQRNIAMSHPSPVNYIQPSLSVFFGSFALLPHPQHLPPPQDPIP